MCFSNDADNLKNMAEIKIYHFSLSFPLPAKVQSVLGRVDFVS